MIDAMYNELRAQGASEHKVNRVHRLLSAAFGRAMRYDWLLSNPCASATKPRVHTKEITPPSPQEVKRIIKAAESVNPDLATCLRVAAATGMRRGELCALLWTDIGEGTITVRRSLVADDDDVLH
ncbi:MAG: tyrosine-type recombinase/integrase, partial [Actinobacteria bacterium]|nr:tyrosine-type recombinase/integrase [Actinomycetota bacterium]